MVKHNNWYLHVGLWALVALVAIAIASCFGTVPDAIAILGIVAAPIGPILIRMWEIGNAAEGK